MMTVEEKPDVTYSDIGGSKEQLERMREVVELPMLHPERFVALGIDPPKVCGVGWSGNCWGLGDRAGCISAAVQ
jgi:ATP-dependent 26S proteasome regulatory subunit